MASPAESIGDNVKDDRGGGGGEVTGGEEETSHYDCIILGTGITEAILAAAFARRGKSVLHLDQNGYYGRDSSSFNLMGIFDEFITNNNYNSHKNSDNSSSSSSNSNSSSGGKYTINSNPINSDFVIIDHYNPVSIFESKVASAKSTSPLSSPPHVEDGQSSASVGSSIDASTRNEAKGDSFGKEDTKPDNSVEQTGGGGGITAAATVAAAPTASSSPAVWYDYKQDIPTDILSQMKSNKYRFLLDFPRTALLFSSGLAVDSIRKSGVGEHYIEFQTIDGIYYCGTVNENLAILPVPCSRGDVFQSSLLSMMEKRCLMKFIQAVHDWGKSFEDGFDLSNLNEVELAQGRSLHRPQNKDSLLNKVDFTSQYDIPFTTFMNTFSLTKKLQDIVVHAICLEMHSQSSESSSSSPKKLSTLSGLKGIYQHLSSLGKIGDGQALIMPVYGSGVFSEAFCRSCAVWGGTYMLRTGIKSVEVLLPGSDLSTSTTTSTATVAVAVKTTASSITTTTTTTTGTTSSSPPRIKVIDDTGKAITCENFVCNVTDWSDGSSKTDSNRRILSSISVFNQPILPKSRSILIIPPLTAGIDNTDAIVVIQYDSSTCAMPDGFYYLGFHTEVSIDDISIDHRSSSSSSSSPSVDSMCMGIIKAAAAVLIKSLNITSETMQLASITCLRPIYNVDHSNLHKNVRLSSCHKGFSISLHEQFEEAKGIFSSLYPDEEFLSCFRAARNFESVDDDVDVDVDGDDKDGNLDLDLDQKADVDIGGARGGGVVDGDNINFNSSSSSSDNSSNNNGNNVSEGDKDREVTSGEGDDRYVDQMDDETEEDFLILEAALKAIKNKTSPAI